MSRPNRWTYIITLLLMLALPAGPVFPAQKTPSYLDLSLKRLAAWGGPRDTDTTTLREISRGNPSLIVYLWQADRTDFQSGPVDETSKVWRVARREMALLRDCVAPSSSHKVISVVTVWSRGRAGSQAEREEVYQKIQDMAKRTGWALGVPAGSGECPMPLFIDVTNTDNTITHRDLAAAIIAETGERNLKPPLLAEVRRIGDRSALRVRGNTPARADAWVRLLDAGSPPDDPGLQIPSDCKSNVFRRHIARVLQAGILRPKNATSEGAFKPGAFMTEQGFVSELYAISGVQARTPPLPGYKPDRPMTRERAIASVAAALYDSQAATGDSCPMPTNAGDWGEALTDTPGSTLIGRYLTEQLDSLPRNSPLAGDLRKQRDELLNGMQLALARGLICFEPALRPDDPIRRDEAAWLLSHALVGHGTDRLRENAGLLVDAIDIPLTPFSFQYQAEIYYRRADQQLVRIYPQAEKDMLPAVPDNYASVFFISQSDADFAVREAPTGHGSGQAGTGARAEWLAQRVGERRFTVRAQDVAGPSRLPDGHVVLASSVVISQHDAEEVLRLNRENGMLDDWRVAFMTGAGAWIGPPLPAFVRRDASITVHFTVPMDSRTVQSPETVWIESAGDVKPAPIPVEIESPQSGTKTLVVRVPKTLVPAGRYRLLLGTGLRTAQGSPMSPHPVPDPSLPVGAVRVWDFRVDPMVQVYLRPAGVPAGWKLEAKVGKEWLEVVPDQLVSLPAGQIELQLRTADGNVFPQQALHVDQDGSYAIKVALPKPARVAVSMPPYVTVGETTRVVLRGIDSEGRVMLRHAPVDVTLSVPSGGVVTPAWLLMTGEAAVDFRPNTPGRATLRISVMDKDVACDPELTVLCRSPLSSQLDWSDEERYHSLSPDQGKRDTRISPRLRRWFAQADEDATPKHRVKLSVTSDGDRRELSESATPPLRYEFKRDSEGFLYVNRNDGDDLLLAYEYRRGRCGLLITGNQGPAPPKELRSELERLLGRIGYECVTDAELVAALGTGYAPGEMPTDAQAAAAIAALSLDDVFAAHLARADRDVYDLSWTVWTRGQAASWSSQGQQVPSRRIRIGTEPGRGVNPKELRAATQALLDPWLKLVGLSFGTDMPRGAR